MCGFITGPYQPEKLSSFIRLGCKGKELVRKLANLFEGSAGGADINCDEEVDLEDLAELVNNWLAD